jgi:putative endonuclease
MTPDCGGCGIWIPDSLAALGFRNDSWPPHGDTVSLFGLSHEPNMYYVYMLASGKHGTLYVGVTRHLLCRTYQHKEKVIAGFTSRYGVDRLVWFEQYDDVLNAIAREKQLKKWRRDWKIKLIEEDNPDWSDRFAQLAR